MKTAELLATFQDFHGQKTGLRARHAAGAAHVPRYEFNNTYQYIVAREDVQISWLERAIRELSGDLPTDVPAATVPPGEGDAHMRAIITDDVRLADEFVRRWRLRVEQLPHARHRRMLEVILGETLEHKRFFEQMLAGRDDLLGWHVDRGGSAGRVLPTRWVE